MGFVNKAIVFGIVALATKHYFTKPVQYPNFGTVTEGYELVDKAFKSNFENGFEMEGAAFAVYKDGNLVVDLWGGYADREYARLWQPDTMSVFFSSTKALGAIVIAMLVDKGHLKYEDLVSKHWPEFAGKGKANITVAMVVSHQAGLFVTKDPITTDTVRDYAKMGRLLEDTVPDWPPGTASGYHGFTIGFLEDQICSRTDPKHRNLSTFLREEVLKPHGIEFNIGYALAENHRLARLVPVGYWQVLRANIENKWILREVFQLIRTVVLPNSRWNAMMANLVFREGNIATFLKPEHADMELPAANGIGTAREFANILSKFVEGKLISKKLLNKINRPIRENMIDLCFGIPISWGYGFRMTKTDQGDWVMGSPGAGGQMVKVDPKNGLSIAYVTNGFGGILSEERYLKLERALYASLK